MISVSSKCKEDCNKDKIIYREFIIVDGITVDINGQLDATAYKDTTFFGTFNMKTLIFETENNINYKGKEFEYFKEVNGESFKIGTFITTDVKDSDTFENVNVTAYDYGLKFANPYMTSLDYDSGNVTMFQVAQEICRNVGVELANESLPNGDFIVDSNQFVSDEQYGDIICLIAAENGMFATINNNDKLEFIFKNETDEIIEDYIELDDKRDMRPISCVLVATSEDLSEAGAVRRDEELVSKYGENWLKIYDYGFAYSTEKCEQLVDNIFNQVKGFGYSSFTSKYSFKPYLTLGDTIQLKNKDGELIFSILTRYNTNYDDITLESPSIINASVEYDLPETAKETAKKALIKADRDAAEIELLTSITQTISENVNNNYYNKTNIDDLIQNAESGVTNTFSEAGGNNIFRNTGLWFEETKDEKSYVFPNEELYPSSKTFAGAIALYEFWTGYAKRTSDENAVNSNAILIQKGSFIQEQDVPNGNYSISFYYQKLNQFANTSVVINDVEYQLDSLEIKQFYTGEQDSETKEYITQPIVVTTKKIKIEFKSSMDDGLKIYDLMCNKGTVKLAYSQNENETTTDTVNISKGITITSTNTETIFKANADGVRLYTLSGQIKTRFTDKGMTTKEAIVEDEAQIVGTLWQEVGDQTWITRM